MKVHFQSPNPSRLELKIPPLLAVFFFMAMSWCLGYVESTSIRRTKVTQVLGAGLAFLGIFLLASSAMLFWRKHTTVDPRYPQKTNALVIQGLYRYSRNPMYLGMALALGGLATNRANLLSFLPIPLFILFMNRYQIQPEEKALEERFGLAFREYNGRVRRWL